MTPTGTDPLEVLREVDPARDLDGPGDAWAAQARAAIVAGDHEATRAPRRARRWAGVAVAAAGVAAVVALMVVLVVAGGDGTPDGPAASLVVVGSTVAPATLDDAAAVVRERVGALGLDGVTVIAAADAQALRVVGEVPEADLAALAAPGRFWILNLERAVAGTAKPTYGAAVAAARADAGLTEPGSALPAGWIVARQAARDRYAESWWPLRTAGGVDVSDIASADLSGDYVGVNLTEAGSRAYTALTREVAEDGALDGKAHRTAIVVDGELVIAPEIDYETHPTGFTDLSGLQFPAGTEDDARRMAAVLGSGPLGVSLLPGVVPEPGTITAFLRDDATPTAIDQARVAFRELLTAGDLTTVEFISKDGAFERLRARLRDPGILDELPSNPLPASFELMPADGADGTAIAAQVRALPAVEQVTVAP